MDDLWIAEDHPGEVLGIRRHTDRCFHAVEEEVEEGYIVQGVLIARDEVAEVRRVTRSASGDDPLSCKTP